MAPEDFASFLAMLSAAGHHIPENAQPLDSMRSLGIDSLELVVMVATLEELGTLIHTHLLGSIDTIGDLHYAYAVSMSSKPDP